MSEVFILKLVICLVGVLMMIITVASLAKRRMNESFCLAWGVISLMLILAGILLHPSELEKIISPIGLVLILIIIFGVLYFVYFVSVKISTLSREKQELAIQVALLNQENQRIMKRLEQMTGLEDREI